MTLLGYKGPLQYETDDDGRVTIHVPALEADHRPCRHAYVFRLPRD